MRHPAAFYFAVTLAVLSSFPTHLTAQQATAPVRVGGNVRPPEKIKHVNPVYPSIAQAARVEGVVILELTVGEDGTVRNAVVLVKYWMEVDPAEQLKRFKERERDQLQALQDHPRRLAQPQEVGSVSRRGLRHDRSHFDRPRAVDAGRGERQVPCAHQGAEDLVPSHREGVGLIRPQIPAGI